MTLSERYSVAIAAVYGCAHEHAHSCTHPFTRSSNAFELNGNGHYVMQLYWKVFNAFETSVSFSCACARRVQQIYVNTKSNAIDSEERRRWAHGTSVITL